MQPEPVLWGVVALDLWALSFAARVEWKAWRRRRSAAREPQAGPTVVGRYGSETILPEGQKLSNTVRVIPDPEFPHWDAYSQLQDE